MVIKNRKFNGKIFKFVICVDSQNRKTSIINDLKNKGYKCRSIKEGTYRNPIWCIYKRK